MGFAFSLLVPDGLGFAVLLALAGAAVVLGRRAKSGIGADLGIVSLVGAAATWFAVTRIVGPVQAFDLTWDKGVPVLALVAVGLSILGHLQVLSEQATPTADPEPPFSRLAERAGAAAMVVVVVAATAAGAAFLIRIATFQISILSSPVLRAAWPYVGPKLQAKTSVLVMPLDPDAYGLAAGILDQLVASDVRVSTPAVWGPEFGIGRVTAGNEQTEVLVDFGPYKGKPPLQTVPGAPNIHYLVFQRQHPGP